jgi:two-component system, OmpR family, response regulator
VHTPIIVIDKGEYKYQHAIACLDAGADDYLTCPFHIPELRCRIQAVHRRAQPRKPVRMQIGSLVVDDDLKTVHVGDACMHLPRHDYLILGHLAVHKNEPVTRKELLGISDDVCDDTNTVDVHIAHIRKALESRLDGTFALETIRGVGYRLAEL